MSDHLDQEVGLKPRNSVFDSPPDVVWQFGELPSRQVDVIQDYIDGKIACHVNLEARNVLGQPELCKYSFIFEKVDAQSFHGFNLDIRRELDGHVELASDGSKEGQSSVPILPGTFMQEAQQLDEGPHGIVFAFTSKARLYALNPSVKLIREWPEVVSLTFKRSARQCDGKINSVFVGNGVSSFLSDCRESKAIKGCSKLIEELAQLEGRIVAARRSSAECDDPCSVGFVLNAKFERVVFDQRVPVICKSISMQLCPSKTIPAFAE